ncbi:hypothetical protein [Sphingomonas parapaucimobilis]|uniref:Uncharacterized protein n=1 Tax=Sphingomonas parapaucimobilis NBRC 15100 TaxID=1219049 RepID=A0A0A1W9Y3_9SPHN|nr:hypothetical protein [Sphingomonas parapaucimobilis]GAM01734.1 hypothetical protein SP5_068_01020 [Sphingomonas parapaucimobilis NBRC 15100]
MNIVATVGRIDPVIETEFTEGVPQQVHGIVVYLNVGQEPMSRSGYIMLGPIISDNELSSMFRIGQTVTLNISAS